MKAFRFAVVGAGSIAGFYMDHFQRRRHKERVAFAGACDLVPERARALAGKHGGRCYGSVADVTADPDVDAVVNLTLPPEHAPVTRQCLAGGKHVLSEKPLALDAADARALVALASRRRLTLACAPFIHLGHAQRRIKRLLEDGRIGRPLTVTAALYHGRMERWNPRAARFYEASGGPVLDVGPYPLTLMVDWFGPVAGVRAMGGTLMPERRGLDGRPFRVRVPDHVYALLRFRSGVIGRVDISNASFRSDQHGMEIQGTGGAIAFSSIMDAHGEIRLTQQDPERWERREGDPAPKPASGVDWSTGIMELARAVRERREPANSGRLAKHVLEVMLALGRALRSGKECALARS